MSEVRLPPQNQLAPVSSAQSTAPVVAPDAAQAVPTAPALIAPDAPALGAGDRPSSPASRGGQRVGIPGLAFVQGQAATATSKTSALELIPGRYPDAVSLPAMLRKMGTTPEGQAVIKQILAQYEAQTGIPVPPALVSAVLAKPERLVDALAARPDQLAAGVDAVNLAFKSGKMKDIAPKARLLPKSFDLANLASAPHERGPMAPKMLVPGLYQGDLPSDLPPAKIKANMVAAEVLDRLADNADMKPADRFKVAFGPHTFTRLDNFLAGLVADGHTVEARVQYRVANFADLKTQAPDGSWLDVPAALLVKTGVKNAAGEEALVPTVHSELVISIRSSDKTKGPALDADVKWYQGISGTGFFPCDLAKAPAWCGSGQSDVFTGAKALEAVELAGLFSDVINASAADQKLAVGGYGATGVCNDSVAIIQHAMTGRALAYPLLMRDETLAAELKERVTDKDPRDDKAYGRLAASVKAVPSDAVANDSARARALASMPWAAGAEPFESVVRAKAILAP